MLEINTGDYHYICIYVGMLFFLGKVKITIYSVEYEKMYLPLCKTADIIPIQLAEFVPLELEGAKLPLCKVAVEHLPTPRGRINRMQWSHLVKFGEHDPPW